MNRMNGSSGTFNLLRLLSFTFLLFLSMPIVKCEEEKSAKEADDENLIDPDLLSILGSNPQDKEQDEEEALSLDDEDNSKQEEFSVEESTEANLLPDENAEMAPKVRKNSTNPGLEAAFLPEEGSAEKEHSSSLTIFFVLSVMILVIFLIHFLLQKQWHHLPESLAIIFLGALIGLLVKMLPDEDAKKVESFSPTMFFLVLLPPIIFESGYNLHKGNFFANIGSILLFTIVGTTISALVVGGGVYLMGLADIVYSFAFGSLISAVDPVATVAIFQAMDVDPVLNMLVFGESILNDAVAIVLTTTVIESDLPEVAELSTMSQVWNGFKRFLAVFLGSAGIGAMAAVVSSIVLKHMDLYHNPSLEFSFMLCFIYLPYALAEGIHLSGIMAILFCGIVMSQYTHYNLSPVTQITVQQTMRTLAFICESCVFAYLGLALFSFPHQFELALIVWSIIFILIGRACNIFPLAMICNKFRRHQITKKMMLIMWFSGLRGTIAYALSLHLEFDEETRKVLVTTTLVVVLFTNIGLGGSTMPFMKCLLSNMPKKAARRRQREITLSKTAEMGVAVDSEYLSEFTEEELESSELPSTSYGGSKRVQGYLYWDAKYIRPFLTRKFTHKEMQLGQSKVTALTDKWTSDAQTSTVILSASEKEFCTDQD